MTRSALLNSPVMNQDLVSYVRFVEPADAEFICALRSDPAQNAHISKSSNDVGAQAAWIEAYKAREAAGQEFYFVLCHKGQNMGVVRMYDFQERSFCWGSWIILPKRPSGFVTYSAVMIYEMGFGALGFEQSHFDVRLGNQKVIDFHLRSGAEKTFADEIDQHFIFSKATWPAFKNASAQQIQDHKALYVQGS